ncbi:MAG: DUF5060 domain-containing protein [Saprospiraceae bacterium]|nr:DUF5060 domain-containing protein [Saprospiraceae bacterium]
MKNIYLTGLQFFTFFVSIPMLTAQAPSITAVTPAPGSVEQWGKFEVKLDVTANWVNPYDYDEIRVAAVFTDPDGLSKTVDGFFMQDHTITNTQTGSLSTVGNGSFKVRFSPDKTGTWTYALSITNAAGTGTFSPQTFSVTAPTQDGNAGFVRSGQTNYLHFDDGKQYIPVGENIAWQSTNAYVDFKNWLTKLSDNDGNFFRLWQCSWGLGLEWRNGSAGYAGLRKYKQNNAFYTDWLLDFCAEKGIYVMYCLQHHGQVSTNVNPNWSDSPYNAANGGPCANTWDFFTNTAAKNHTKNRYRYVLARWGYSRNIMSWELFNEVGWTDQFEQRKADIADWHAEMAAYLKTNDPNVHLVTTSYVNEYNDPNTWSLPDIDFTQTHFYVETPYLERALATGVRSYLNDYGKATINGEFGLSGSGSGLGALDPDGIHIHNSMWGSLFAGGMGTGMSWWWDNYIDPKNLYFHFAPISAVARVVPLQATNMSPASAGVSGVPADLLLSPTQGWGAVSDTSLTINSDGSITSAGAGLGQFLYGSQWNTQHRRPPVFYANYPSSGQFKVKTAGDSGQSPKIVIWVDGVKVLEQNAVVNQTYSVNVSAGQHTIKVDNSGTDWIAISSYTFSGLGSAVDAYVLKSDSQNRVAGWVLNNSYNHEYVQANGAPAAASGGTLHVPNMSNGSYTAKYFDCMTGALLSSAPVTVSNGALSLNLPDLLWDMAFLVEDQSVAVAEVVQNLDFKVFPSPATPGATVTLDFTTDGKMPIAVSLLDMEGRTLRSLFAGDSTGDRQQLSVALPDDLPGGLYWVKMQNSEGRVGTKAVVVAK